MPLIQDRDGHDWDYISNRLLYTIGKLIKNIHLLFVDLDCPPCRKLMRKLLNSFPFIDLFYLVANESVNYR